MEMLMYLNPDNTVGVIICNKNSAEQRVVFVSTKHSVSFMVPAKCVASLIWQE